MLQKRHADDASRTGDALKEANQSRPIASKPAIHAVTFDKLRRSRQQRVIFTATALCRIGAPCMAMAMMSTVSMMTVMGIVRCVFWHQVRVARTRRLLDLPLVVKVVIRVHQEIHSKR